MCSWYQIVGGSAALSSLQVKLAEQKERHTELLRKAPTAVVKKDISKTETYIKRINEGITFCEVALPCPSPHPFCPPPTTPVFPPPAQPRPPLPSHPLTHTLPRGGRSATSAAAPTSASTGGARWTPI